jgi:hypothetical protein
MRDERTTLLTLLDEVEQVCHRRARARIEHGILDDEVECVCEARHAIDGHVARGLVKRLTIGVELRRGVDNVAAIAR